MYYIVYIFVIILFFIKIINILA